MAGKNLTLKQINTAIVLREAGYTLTAIAERIHVSVSSLQRAFKKHSVKKDSMKTKAIENAREELMGCVTSSEEIKLEAAKLVSDDLAHSRLLREKAALTIESLTATDTTEAALTMRALVGYSTLIKNTSDTLRRSLGLNNVDTDSAMEDLPELTIRELTADEIEELRDRTHEIT